MSEDARILGKIEGTLEALLKEVKSFRRDMGSLSKRVSGVEKQQALISGVGLALLGLASIIGAVAIFWS